MHAARGYPEIPANCYVDGTLLYAAVAHGYGQLLLAGRCSVLHQSHDTRSQIVLDRSVLGPAEYRELAQGLLDAGPFANHRADGDNARLSPEQRPMHQWNDALWGLADAAVMQVVLVGSCDAL